MEQERIDRLWRHINDGTLLRWEWGDGYERACLLAALVPETIHRGGSCPADVMPSWLATITPAMDDNGTQEAWPSMVRRYADLAGKWHILTDAAWERVRRQALITITESAVISSHLESTRTMILDWLRSPDTSDDTRKSVGDAVHRDVYNKRFVTVNKSDIALCSITTHPDTPYSVSSPAGLASFWGPSCWDRLSNSILDAIAKEIENA